MKYLLIYSAKYVQDSHIENFKTGMKEAREDLSKQPLIC